MRIIAFAIICSSIMIAESLTVRIYGYSTEPSRLFTLVLFSGFITFFGFANIYFLTRLDRSYLRENRSVFQALNLKGTVVIQISIGVIYAILISEMFLYGSYHQLLLTLIVWTSHLMAIIYLTFISYQFFNWFLPNRNYILLVYCAAFSCLAVNVIISIIYLSIEISSYDDILHLRGIKRQVFDSQSPTPMMNFVGDIYDFNSSISFILTWVPTVVLLKIYFLGIKRITYYILVTIPIIYYFFPLISDEFGLFEDLRFGSDRTLTFYYMILFSPYKQIGGLFFGMVFWLASRKIGRENLRMLLQIASVGMILIFGSTVLYGLTYVVAPPFGIVTISFIGISSYMLAAGIFYAITNVARDSVSRVTLYRVMKDQISLINNASFAERERILKKSVKQVLNKMDVVEDDGYNFQQQELNVSQMVQEVLDEINASRKAKKELQ